MRLSGSSSTTLGSRSLIPKHSATSPAYLVDAETAPLFLVHSQFDPMPFSQQADMTSALDALGAHQLPGADVAGICAFFCELAGGERLRDRVCRSHFFRGAAEPAADADPGSERHAHSDTFADCFPTPEPSASPEPTSSPTPPPNKDRPFAGAAERFHPCPGGERDGSHDRWIHCERGLPKPVVCGGSALLCPSGVTMR